jgi:hypothetical protein
VLRATVELGGKPRAVDLRVREAADGTLHYSLVEDAASRGTAGDRPNGSKAGAFNMTPADAAASPARAASQAAAVAARAQAPGNAGTSERARAVAAGTAPRDRAAAQSQAPPPEDRPPGGNASSPTAPKGAVSVSGNRAAHGGAGVSMEIATQHGAITAHFASARQAHLFVEAESFLGRAADPAARLESAKRLEPAVSEWLGMRPGSLDPLQVIRFLQDARDQLSRRAAEAAQRGETSILVDSFADPAQEGNGTSWPAAAPTGLPAEDGVRVKANRQTGLDTEAAVGTQHGTIDLQPDGVNFIPGATKAKRSRRPDILTLKTIGEIKNRAKMHLSRQLKDYMAYAEKHGLEFVLHASRRMKCSGPLREAIAMGRIRLVYFDGPNAVRGPPPC